MFEGLSDRLYRFKKEGGRTVMTKKKKWYDYFWLWCVLYFVLGYFNILFAWLGMFDFLTPLLFAVLGGNKFFCNHLCGRSQLLTLIPKITKQKINRNKPTPAWMASKRFRYGFLAFFMAMFGTIVWQTWLVFGGASLKQAITLFWTFRLPWNWAYTAGASPEWVAQFAFGFYSLMLTSALIGIVLMVLYKPRTWCAFCPMGTMTQIICKLKHRKEIPNR